MEEVWFCLECRRFELDFKAARKHKHASMIVAQEEWYVKNELKQHALMSNVEFKHGHFDGKHITMDMQVL